MFSVCACVHCSWPWLANDTVSPAGAPRHTLIRYRAEPVQRLIDATLKKHLTGVPYAADKVAELVRVMTAEILAGVKGIRRRTCAATPRP